MALKHFTGMESGVNAEFSSTSGTVEFNTGTVKTGAYSFRANPTTTATGLGTIVASDEATTWLLTVWNEADVYIEFQFLVADLPDSNSEYIMRVVDAGVNLKLGVTINSAGNLIALDATGATLGTGSTALSLNTWYRIGVRCGTSATVGPYEIQINGVTELSGTGNLDADNSIGIQIGKVINLNGNTVDFFYDDLVIDDAGFVGNAEVKIAVANANGATMAWTGGTGASDYTQVDEIPFGTTDYVQSTAQNDVALFDVQDCATTGVSGTIHGVAYLGRVQRAGGTNGTMVCRLESSGTNGDSASTTTTAGVATRMHIFSTDPDTSAAWTTGGIDAVEVGGVDNNGAGNRNRIHSATISILYTPSAGPVSAPGNTIQFLQLMGVGT